MELDNSVISRPDRSIDPESLPRSTLFFRIDLWFTYYLHLFASFSGLVLTVFLHAAIAYWRSRYRKCLNEDGPKARPSQVRLRDAVVALFFFSSEKWNVSENCWFGDVWRESWVLSRVKQTKGGFSVFLSFLAGYVFFNIYLFIYPAVFSWICLSFCLTVYLCFYLPIRYLSVYLSERVFMYVFHVFLSYGR